MNKTNRMNVSTISDTVKEAVLGAIEAEANALIDKTEDKNLKDDFGFDDESIWNIVKEIEYDLDISIADEDMVKNNPGDILSLSIGQLYEIAQIQYKEEGVSNLHDRVMSALQTEWEVNNSHHTAARRKFAGIRSSQISALVEYLIEIGVIKDEDL